MDPAAPPEVQTVLPLLVEGGLLLQVLLLQAQQQTSNAATVRQQRLIQLLKHTEEEEEEECNHQRHEGRGRSEVTGSYRGLSMDQSVDIRWRQEADLLQQVAVFPEKNSDL